MVNTLAQAAGGLGLQMRYKSKRCIPMKIPVSRGVPSTTSSPITPHHVPHKKIWRIDVMLPVISSSTAIFARTMEFVDGIHRQDQWPANRLYPTYRPRMNIPDSFIATGERNSHSLMSWVSPLVVSFR